MKKPVDSFSMIVFLAYSLLLNLLVNSFSNIKLSNSLNIDGLLSDTDLTALEQQLVKVAGVYESHSGVYSPQLQRTVVVTACNYGFLNHLLNFDCFMRRLNMKYLVFSMDLQVHQAILQNHSHILSYLMVGNGEITSLPTEFRSKQFNLITARKKAAVQNILRLGYNVLFSDTDVALLRDPFPYLLWSNVDYAHSLNAFCKVNEGFDFFYKTKLEGNTGFYFVRSSEATIKLWRDTFVAAPKHPRLDDQAVFWKVFRSSKDPIPMPIGRCRSFNTSEDIAYLKSKSDRYLVSCVLDTCVFSSGMLSRLYEPELTYETLISNLKILNETICAVHANYMSGNKKKRDKMREHGFWLMDYTAEGKAFCHPYVQIPLNASKP